MKYPTACGVDMLSKLGAVAALLGLAAVAAWIYVSLDRPVRSVEVVGALAPAEAAEVQRRLTELKPGRLLSTDLGALREHLMALSWPRLVQIRRVWPDTISIRIERQLVVAKWGGEGYLTAGGELVSGLDRAVSVPLLDCEIASPQKALEIYRHLQDIAAEDGLEIRSLVENALGEWRLELGNGVRAHLGADALRSRMARFMQVHRHLAQVNAQPVRYLDVRYANGAAVRFDEPQMLANR
ncbi:MAG: FtsQ-type POTRA domain-containing protein [Gammaproteobacteria bacterium]|nr:FtsQ-type POTRA domain-containing protein [Gammaproteobacteria bacterium]